MPAKLNFLHSLFALLLCFTIGMQVYFLFKTESEKNKKILEGIPEAYHNNKKTIDAAIDSLLKLQGGIYVYTNDMNVSAKWVPDLSEKYIITDGSVKSLAAEQEAKKDFLIHKDSLGFKLLLKAANNVFYTVNKSILLGDENCAAEIWFLVCGKKNAGVDTIQRQPPARKADFVSSWGVRISNDSTLLKTQFKNLAMLQTAAILLKPEKSYFYVIGYNSNNGKKNIDILSFQYIIKEVALVLKNEGIDVQQFNVYYFSNPNMQDVFYSFATG